MGPTLIRGELIPMSDTYFLPSYSVREGDRIEVARMDMADSPDTTTVLRKFTVETIEYIPIDDEIHFQCNGVVIQTEPHTMLMVER